MPQDNTEMENTADAKSEPSKSKASIPQAARMRSSMLSDTDDLMMSDARKGRVVLILFFVVFLDFLGNTMMAPIVPFLFNPDPSASQAMKDNGKAVFAEDAKSIGVASAMSAHTLGVLVGQAISSVCGVCLMSVVGKRKSFLIYTVGGAVFGVLSGLSIMFDWTMWGFLGLRFMTGLCSGSMPAVMVYISEIFASDPGKMQSHMARAGLPVAGALAIGPLFGGVLIGPDFRMYLPLFAAAIFECIAGLMVLFFVPEPEAPKRSSQVQAAAPGDGEDKRGFGKWIAVFWTAIFLDCATGPIVIFRYMQLVFFFKFPELSQNFTLCVTLLSITMLLGPPVFLKLKDRLGLAWTPALTQCLGAVSCLCMKFLQELSPILVVFYLGCIFSAAGQPGRMPALVAMVPGSQKQKWIGLQSALSTLSMGIGPMILSPLMDAESWGPYPKGCSGIQCHEGQGSLAEGTFFYINSGLILLSALCYALLSIKFPCPKRSATEKQSENARLGLEHYEATGDARWLTLHQKGQMLMESFENDGTEGLATLQNKLLTQWGTFQDDLEKLDHIRSIGREDFAYAKGLTSDNLMLARRGGPEWDKEVNKIREYQKTIRAPTQEEKAEMGAWVFDYLQYAGYSQGHLQPNVYKSSVMAAFPPMLENGWLNQELVSNTNEVYPDYMKNLNRHFTNLLQLDERYTKQQGMVQGYFTNVKHH